MSKTNIALLTPFLVILAFIFFQVAFDASPMAIGRYLVAQVGSAIGVTVSVPPNPFNTLAQQLKEKESALSDREKKLQAKESALETEINKGQSNQNKTLIYLAAVGGILLALILANFYFDYRRRRASRISN